MSWIKIATLIAALLLVVSLQSLVGVELAHVLMWGIAGIKLGDWAQRLGTYLENRYG